MSSRGNSFLAGYWPFVRRFLGGYLIACCAILAGLMVADAAFPQVGLYGRIKDFLQASFQADHPVVQP
jgi:hypothetical protein